MMVLEFLWRKSGKLLSLILVQMMLPYHVKEASKQSNHDHSDTDKYMLRWNMHSCDLLVPATFLVLEAIRCSLMSKYYTTSMLSYLVFVTGSYRSLHLPILWSL